MSFSRQLAYLLALLSIADRLFASAHVQHENVDHPFRRPSTSDGRLNDLGLQAEDSNSQHEDSHFEMTISSATSQVQERQTTRVDHHTTDCKGRSMAMFMDGFHSYFFHSSSSQKKQPCLSFLVGFWQLTTSLRLVVAMIYSFLMALLLEYLSMVQLHFQQSKRRSRRKELLLYASTGFLGYLTMLIVMSYSVELILSLVCGLMAGIFFFCHALEPEGPCTSQCAKRENAGWRRISDRTNSGEKEDTDDHDVVETSPLLRKRERRAG